MLWKLVQSPDTWPVYLNIINKTQNIRNINVWLRKQLKKWFVTHRVLAKYGSFKIYQKTYIFLHHS